MTGLLTARSGAVRQARQLVRGKQRRATGRFLAEGPQAIAEALAAPADPVVELFATAAGADGHEAIVASAGHRLRLVDDEALAALAGTVTSQGLVAVCRLPVAPPLPASARLVAVAVGISDPGNAGTLIRTADAAGADAVVFTHASVDPYNPKAVRAGVGSHFHLPVLVGTPLDGLPAWLGVHGLTTLATTGLESGPAGTADDLDELIDGGALDRPSAWLFGSEAHGLPAEVLTVADRRVRIPLHGAAESLNLTTAAAICLYASARAHRQAG